MEPYLLTPKVTELETTTASVYYFTKYRKENTIQTVKEVFPGTTLWPAPCFSWLPCLQLNYIVKISLVDLSYLFYIEIEPLGILAQILN